ncbi:MAG: hypothetical protein AB7I30_05070 [Isosphaeraceae bacterium]
MHPMVRSLTRLVPSPVRRWGRDTLLRRGWGDYPTRLRYEAVPRPNYGYCVYHGARLAQRLGHPRISVLEFGVAGGGGLIALEDHAAEVSKVVGVEIDVYGFDTGAGLPAPEDYRDLPYHWQAGFFAMDRQALEAKLRRAKLIYGDIRQTVHDFVAQHKPAPVAAVMHDMDYYSSTAAALSLFDADPAAFLPRVFCYFDDVIGSEIELYSDYTGQRLAIEDFNRAHPTKKVAKNYHLVSREIVKTWYHQIFIYHHFDHPEYNRFISDEGQQLPLGA